MKYRTTFITCFHDPASVGFASRRPYETYIEDSKAFTLRLRQPLIIFIDSKFVETIKEFRDSLGLGELTKIYSIDLQDTEYYCKYGKKILEYTYDEWISKQPGFHITTWLKFEHIKQGIIDNPFSSDNFIWIDFGLGHRQDKYKNQNLYELQSCITDKIKLVMMGYMDDMYTNINNRYHRLSANIITGSLNNMVWLCATIARYVEISFTSNHCPRLEEPILGTIYGVYSDKFEPYTGEYDSCILNFYYQQNRTDYLIQAGQECLNKQYINQIELFVLPIYKSYINKNNILTDNQLYLILKLLYKSDSDKWSSIITNIASNNVYIYQNLNSIFS